MPAEVAGQADCGAETGLCGPATAMTSNGRRHSIQIHTPDTGARYRGRVTTGRDAMTAWLALGFAGLLEIVGAFGLKYTSGFTRLWPSVGTLVAIGLSF